VKKTAANARTYSLSARPSCSVAVLFWARLLLLVAFPDQLGLKYPALKQLQTNFINNFIIVNVGSGWPAVGTNLLITVIAAYWGWSSAWDCKWSKYCQQMAKHLFPDSLHENLSDCHSRTPVLSSC
jgi:hypothetical protein